MTAHKPQRAWMHHSIGVSHVFTENYREIV